MKNNNFKKAIGYEYKENKSIEVKKEILVNGEKKIIKEQVEVEIKKYKKPSLSAQKKILKWDN